MANPIGTAYIRIMPESKGIESTIGGTVADATEKGGEQGGKKYISALKKVITVAAIGKFIGDSLDLGAALQQSTGGIETLYKGASEKMMKYANQAYKTAGVDANTYMEQVTSYSAGLIASMGGDVDAAADVANMAMIDMADNASKLGSPLESLQVAYQGFAKQNYTMLDNLKLGYGGTKTEMQRLLADAQKITGVKYDISNLDDVYKAIHVIQTEIGITGTTQKEAAETISGSIGMMKASYKDLMANLALGNDVFPQIKNLASSIITVFKNVVPAIGNIIVGIPKAIITHLPEIKAAFLTMSANALASFKQNFPVWRAAFVQLVTNGGTAIINNIPKIVAAVGRILKTAVSLIKQYAPSILSAVGLILANLLKTLVKNIPAILRSAFNLAKSIIKSAFTLIKTIATSAFTGFKTMVSTLFSNIIGSVKNRFDSIKTTVSQKLGNIKTSIANGVATFTAKLTAPFTSAREKIKGIIDKIKGFFPLKAGKLFENFKLPRFDVTGKFPYGIGGKGEKPGFSIKWYAQGGIMTKPTLFGGGEAGAEAIMPLDPFWARLDDLVDGVNNSGDITINVYGGNMDPAEIAEEVERRLIQSQNRRRLAWQ